MRVPDGAPLPQLVTRAEPVELRLGDCLDVLATLPDASVDAAVTDPPYGINFMGKAWDGAAITEAARSREDLGPSPERLATGRRTSGFTSSTYAGAYDFSLRGNRAFQAWVEVWAAECLRLLKPGGHLVSFGGTRTYHRLAAGVEDAGFEIRDQLAWMFGSGFPKSLDVAKAIDRQAGHWRGRAGEVTSGNGSMSGANYERTEKGEPVTAAAAAAAAAAGWGTALKPGYEPIVLARKPLAGTVAANVIEHGTGAINIDGCRIPIDDRDEYERNHSGDRGHSGTREPEQRGATDLRPGGGSAADARWPANVLFDVEAAEILDEQTGELRSGANPTSRGSDKFRGVYGDFAGQEECEPARGADAGGASRFFYVAKVDADERQAGLATPSLFAQNGPARNDHPTVKPISLMRWLCRLVTPPGGLIIDPFLGSGTTGIAAGLERFRFLGIEREEAYMRIAEARIGHWLAMPVEASA